MPGSRSTPPAGATPPSGPRAALQALLDGAEGGTLRRALWLDAVDQLLRPHLPPVLAAHARLGNVHDGRLVYLVDAAAWHARLRLAGPELIDAARSIGLEVSALVVKTSRMALAAPAAPPNRRGPDPGAARKAAAALDLCKVEGFGTTGNRPDPPVDRTGGGMLTTRRSGRVNRKLGFR